MKSLFVVISFLGALFAAGAHAAEAPRLFDAGQRLTAPDLTGLPRLRFLTSLDFPPFNFADRNKKPTGFNVDLARAICAELGLQAKCEIQALPWEELEPALDARRGEAIVAGTAISDDKRAKYNLSDAYFRFPARFVARKDASGSGIPANGSKIAVVDGSAHAAMLERHFPALVPVKFADLPAAYGALTGSTVDAIFGDGVTLSFWLASPASNACCKQVGGAYLSEKYSGFGMAIVTRAEDVQLIDAINAALRSVQANGTYDRIFNSYFPVDPFALGQ